MVNARMNPVDPGGVAGVGCPGWGAGAVPRGLGWVYHPCLGDSEVRPQIQPGLTYPQPSCLHLRFMEGLVPSLGADIRGPRDSPHRPKLKAGGLNSSLHSVTDLLRGPEEDFPSLIPS